MCVKGLLLATSCLLFQCLFGQQESIGDRKIEMSKNGVTLTVPYYSNHGVDQGSDNITQAVIVIHGVNRNADDYFNNMHGAASIEEGVLEKTIIIAPQFLKEEDIDFNNLDDNHVFWTSRGWRFGDNSLSSDANSRSEAISSYAALDTVLIRLAENYQNLHRIIVTGHSGGGQVTNRYAASNRITELLWNEYEIGVRYIVMNPSSYVYLDNKRVKQGTVDQFELPSGCSSYNEYGYGLNGLFPYQSETGVSTIIDQYKDREVIYLLGGNDNDPNSSSLDTSCDANLQGAHRLERGTIYFNHLVSVYGESIKSQHAIDTIPSVGHSNSGMFQSSEGRHFLFQKPFIKEPLVADFAINQSSNCTRDVAFRDESLGRATAYLWDFGDGNTSILRNPTHTYDEIGTFKATLEIRKGEDVETIEKDVIVEMDEVLKPEINFVDGRLITNASGESFQWYYEGDLLDGETNRLLSQSPLKGLYQVEIIGNSCSVISDPFLVLSTIEKDTINLYPNPASNVIFIQSPKLTNGCSISLYSVAGKLIVQKEIRKEEKVIAIPVSDLKQGTYLVEVQDEQFHQVFKVVIR